MIISAKPLRGHKAGAPAQPNGFASRLLAFPDGRAAMRFAIDHLVAVPAPRILVPALFCQSALEPLAGSDITYYDVAPDGSVDSVVLRGHIATGAFDAVIVNHLFGGTPPWRDTVYAQCQANNTILIDDMCHCPAGVMASDDASDHVTDDEDAAQYDARIFSFRKFLPVPTGGAAQIHPRFAVPRPTAIASPSWRDRTKFLIEKLVFAAGQKWLWRLAMMGRSSDQPVGPIVPPPPPALPPAVLSDAIARMVSDRAMMATMRDCRRAHFDQLAAIMPPVNAKMSPTDAPQVCAVADPGGRIKTAMQNAGIACYNWPAAELPFAVRQNPDAFPHAVALADTILCLPVHQDVSPTALRHIAGVLAQHTQAKASQ